MDFEAPVDAWYVWIAVGIVSIAIAGVAIGLPSGPPPDANQAANTVDGVTGSSYEASGSYEHDADEVRIDGKQISMRNEHGTSHASLAFGTMVPVMDHEAPASVAYGASVEEEFDSRHRFTGYKDSFDPSGGNTPRDLEMTPVSEDGHFLRALYEANADNSGEWREANGEVVVRKVSLDGDEWNLVWYAYVNGKSPSEYIDHPDDADRCEDASINCGGGFDDRTLDEGVPFDTTRPESEQKQLTADQEPWLEYDSDNDRFYVTVITA